MKIKRGILLPVLLQFGFLALVQGQPVKQVELSNFRLQSTELVHASGKELSGAGYQSKVYWFPVRVPCTVLSGLVANHIYPDPHQGMNNMRIPDASDEFNKTYKLEQYSYIPNVGNPWKKAYWYRTSFNVPAKDRGQHFQLIFKGINYRASVWLNGEELADSSRMVGMFAQYSLDVSRQVIPGKSNYLAVKIYPLDYPGLPSSEQLKALGPFYPNGGPTGDIGKNVTMLCSAGWDWMPPVRDRNMGIWQPVYLRTTGDVTISDPQVVTTLPNLPDTSIASITLALQLNNNGKVPHLGTLDVSIRPANFKGESFHFSQSLSLNAGTSMVVKFDPVHEKKLMLSHPHLWWPNGHGPANLYRLRLKYISGNRVSDDTTFVFGVRTVSSKSVRVNGKYLRRDFYVNGRKVNLVGGAWVPDMLVNRDSLRYDNELRLCRNGNINLVRIWGGGITPPDDFFNAADRYGLLVWSDFWITGDTNGGFKGSPEWPLETNVFINNMTSTILRIRNHPSLLVWTGGNEGHARKELYDAMRDSVISLDGTRPFIPCSSGFAKLPAGWKGAWPDNEQSGVYSGGPYSWKDPKAYFALADTAKDWVFKDETGIPSQPPYNILAKIIPDLVWDKTLPFPLNNSWGYHDAATGSGRYDQYYKDMVSRYGPPSSMQDFSEKMQLMNAAGYQAIFESAGSRLGQTGGVLLWKLNAALPSVIWQVYDWYLEPNSGYYFMKRACEPVHVQFDQDDQTVAIVNRSYHKIKSVTVESSLYSIGGRLIDHQVTKGKAGAESVRKVFSLNKALSNTSGVSFILLRMKDARGNIISRNAYWYAPDDNFKSLNTMNKIRIEAAVIARKRIGAHDQWTLQLTNPSGEVAFFVRPMLMNKEEEVLPSFWSSSYLTLKPGESVTLTVESSVKDQDPSIKIEGWNIDPVSIPAE